MLSCWMLSNISIMVYWNGTNHSECDECKADTRSLETKYCKKVLIYSLAIGTQWDMLQNDEHFLKDWMGYCRLCFLYPKSAVSFIVIDVI